MFNIDNYEIYEQVNILALFVGIVFGAIAQKNQFCFSGSIKDYILSSSTRRMASAIFAIIIAIISTSIIALLYDIDLKSSVYYKDEINYFSIILGATLFGIGMMISDGCSSRHLIKFAQGDSKSLVVLLFIAIFAYASTKGALHPLVSSITTNSFLLELSSYITNFTINIYLLIIILSIFLFIIMKKIKRIIYLKDGFIIGLLVAASWAITGILGEQSMDRNITLQGLTFVYPNAKTLEFFTYYEITNLSFGVSIIIGVLMGAFLMSKINRRYSFGCTANIKGNGLKNNMIGGAMMGIGGVMAIGCTVGQGLSGLSTLAFASFVAVTFIFISAYITAKILNKTNSLPMCFLFDWDDEDKDKTKTDSSSFVI